MSECHNTKLSRIQLPFTFEIEPSLSAISKSISLSITVLQPVSNLNLNILPKDFTNTCQLIFKLRRDIFNILHSFSANYFFVKIQKRTTDNDWQNGIIYSIFNEYFGMIQLPKDIKSKNISINCTEKIPSYTSINEIILKNQIYPETSNIEKVGIESIIQKFSMKPPQVDNDTHIEQGIVTNNLCLPQQIQDDPLTFLISRYFNILYSLNTPLSYFPKTALTRFKNLCKNDQNTLKLNLKKLYLSIDELDARHQGKYGIIKLIENSNDEISDSFKDKYERENQKEFIKKHYDLITKVRRNMSKTEGYEGNEIVGARTNKEETDTEDKLHHLVLELKIREAQLQILILLELLTCWGIPEKDFLHDSFKRREKELKKLNKQSKQSLVRKRKPNTSRKIVPTFLGMGVDLNISNTVEESQLMNLDEYGLYNTLNTLIDRMGLWDVLSGRASNNKDDSSYGFLAYVLVPYFNKKLPMTTKHIIENVKRLDLKSIYKPRRQDRDSKQKKLSVEVKNLSSKSFHMEKSESRIQSSRSSKYNKVLLGTKNLPSLKRTSSKFSADDDLLPAFSLKRSKSNLSSKNLQKRQVDMSLNLRSLTEMKHEAANSKVLQKSKSSSEKLDSNQSFIFGNARKMSSQTIFRANAQGQTTPSKKNSEGLFSSISFSQIEATPNGRKSDKVANTKNSQVEATPSHSNRIRKNFIFDEITRTPEDKLIGSHSRNKVTTQSDIQRQTSISDKLLNASLAVPDVETIISSPMSVRRTLISSPDKRRSSNPDVIASSPIDELQWTSIEDFKSSPSIRQSSFSMRRRKPGDPVSIQESPFFSANLDDSPNFSSSFKVNEYNDEFGRGIFMRTSRKRELTNSVFIERTAISKDLSRSKDNDTDADGSDSDYELLISSSKGLVPKAQKTYSKSGRQIK